MKFTLHTMLGETFQVDIPSHTTDMTAFDIKKQIEMQTGIPIKNQRILCSGKEWEDSMTNDTFAHKLGKSLNEYTAIHLVFLSTASEGLPSIVSELYKTIKEHNSDLACEISVLTRTKRMCHPSRPDTETYWNGLSDAERIAVLKVCKSSVESAPSLMPRLS